MARADDFRRRKSVSLQEKASGRHHVPTRTHDPFFRIRRIVWCARWRIRHRRQHHIHAQIATGAPPDARTKAGSPGDIRRHGIRRRNNADPIGQPGGRPPLSLPRATHADQMRHHLARGNRARIGRYARAGPKRLAGAYRSRPSAVIATTRRTGPGGAMRRAPSDPPERLQAPAVREPGSSYMYRMAGMGAWRVPDPI